MHGWYCIYYLTYCATGTVQISHSILLFNIGHVSRSYWALQLTFLADAAPHHINVPSTGKWMQLEHFVTEERGEGGIVIRFSLQVFVVTWNIKKTPKLQEKSEVSSASQ